jgi:hypothetical protein
MKDENGQTSSHEKLCKLHEDMLRDIHMAVCGNDRLGVSGLVNDMREIKAWRRGIDLRVAKVSGLITALVLFGKYIWTKL